MNSLTANNRLSQQLVVSVAEHLLLRHECRLPNHLAVSNHRELYLTVGGELCRNLTAGFVTEEGFMSMLFVGSQKHSALSIFAKTTRMSALVLCGNSGVILLSVKDHQHIDSAIPGRYTVQAPYKAGVGIGVLELHTATIGALASFLLLQLSYTQIMVGWVGAPKGAPVSVCAGYANPAQFTTSEIGVSGGGSYPLHTEAAIMATVPTLSQPEIAIVDGQAVTSSLAVADFFSKRHDDVLKKIRILDCSPEFCARNFAETSILVRQPNGGTRKLPCYQITRDGFAFLAMGFTGKRAARFKEAYINAFNQMEKQLSKPSVPSDVAHNASVLCSYISSIHQVWLQQLYPMLEKAESPLAVSLYDRINDAAFLARLIHSSLNSSEVRGRK
ncbi:Rha family transcriptional regulator [Escherichia coli]|uniref:Rha family phage regulatory protein n=3 Tax=Enterobacteriaceae TaxID=543 RepID=UPI0013097032|nr:Rha family transcriptional regulator [Escherichia coli]MBE1751762.1 Rha family transcriptional regulator [Escherichia coli]MWF92435.1 peptidase [Escherichia coli]HAH6090656.1 peptidase [Escherichia coli]HBC1673406.1 Rha family transcriptional regulator [Escherichia coli]